MKELIKQIGDIFGGAGISYSETDVKLLIAVANQFNRSGYNLTYNECAKFLTNKKNLEMIKNQGITKTIKAMSLMKLGTIKRAGPKIGRNDKCACDSERKYKQCCLKNN